MSHGGKNALLGSCDLSKEMNEFFFLRVRMCSSLQGLSLYSAVSEFFLIQAQKHFFFKPFPKRVRVTYLTDISYLLWSSVLLIKKKSILHDSYMHNNTH